MEILTIVADIKTGSDVPLRKLLDTITPKKLFKRKFKTLHFASFVIFPAATLGTTLAKLVFDFTVDDGQAEAFVAACEAHPTIQRIYSNCVDYQPLTGYLWKRKRRPQLYHIGTPYRTAASIRTDRALRLRLDRQLFSAGGPTQLDRSPRGMVQYWLSDVLQPWLALIVAALLVSLAAAPPVAGAFWADYPWPVKWTLRLLDIAVAVAGIGIGGLLWSNSMPALRDRVKAWTPGIVAAAVVTIIVARSRASHPWRSIGLAVLLTIGAALAISTAVQRRRNQRLADIRADRDTRAIVRVWERLLRRRFTGDERPAWWRVLRNFFWWLASPVLIFAGLVVIRQIGGRPATVVVLTALFFAETVGLNLLVGWPAIDGPWLGFSSAGARFIALATLSAAWLTFALTALPHWWVVAAALTAVVLLAFFGLWQPTLTPPRAQSHPLTRAELVALLDQEERDVQNHMAACVVLRDSDRPTLSRFRVWTLKTFLAILNRVFFRAWLPDVCKGKLFMLPTVHAAQWLILDRRNYLFLSNYDNSWTTYLDDFGASLGQGIEKIWGQGRDNPGVKKLGAFKDFARSTMVPYSLWYQAYPGLTVRQIWNNEHIRREVAAGAEEERIVAVIRRFGAAPRIPDDLVTHAAVN